MKIFFARRNRDCVSLLVEPPCKIIFVSFVCNVSLLYVAVFVTKLLSFHKISKPTNFAMHLLLGKRDKRVKKDATLQSYRMNFQLGGKRSRKLIAIREMPFFLSVSNKSAICPTYRRRSTRHQPLPI